MVHEHLKRMYFLTFLNVVSCRWRLSLSGLLFLFVYLSLFKHFLIGGEFQYCIGFWPTLTWTSFPPPTPNHPQGCHRAPDLISLHHTANSHWLSVLQTLMYISVLLSQTLPLLLSPIVSKSLFLMAASPLQPCRFVHQCYHSKFHPIYFD